MYSCLPSSECVKGFCHTCPIHIARNFATAAMACSGNVLEIELVIESWRGVERHDFQPIQDLKGKLELHPHPMPGWTSVKYNVIVIVTLILLLLLLLLLILQVLQTTTTISRKDLIIVELLPVCTLLMFWNTGIHTLLQLPPLWCFTEYTQYLSRTVTPTINSILV